MTTIPDHIIALVAVLGGRDQPRATRREKLDALSAVGAAAVAFIVDAIKAAPTAEVMHDAAAVLSEITASPCGLSAVCSAAKNEDESVRATAVMALASVRGAENVVLTALHDASAEVRDAAASAIAEARIAGGAEALRAALTVEVNAAVRASLRDAIDELPTHPLGTYGPDDTEYDGYSYAEYEDIPGQGSEGDW